MKTGARRQVGQSVLLRVYGVVFLIVIALLVSLTVAIYNKVFVDVVHVTLETDRVGNQLAPPADVKLRGLIVGEVRQVSSDGTKATIDLALTPSTVGPDPGQRPGAAAAQDAVRREVRRPGASRRGQPRDGCPRVTSSPRTGPRTAIELETVLDNILPLLRTDPAGEAQRDARRLRDRAGGTRRPAGREPRAGQPVLHRAQPRARDDQEGHRGSRRRQRDLRRCRARPRADAAQLLGDDRDDRRQAAGVRRFPGRHGWLRDDDAHVARATTRTASSGWPPSAGRRSRSWPSTRRSIPACCRASLSPTSSSATAFANGELHITLEVIARPGRVQTRRRAAVQRQVRAELPRPAEASGAAMARPISTTARTVAAATAPCPASCSTRRPAAPALRRSSWSSTASPPR